MSEGFLLVDKPAGMSSFRVVHRVRALTGVQRVGHAGTLDPFATGLLVIAMGRAFTRQLDYFQSLPKVYDATMVLGTETSTLDPEGEVVALDPEILSVSSVEISSRFCAVRPGFLGEIFQVPPVFSAKKVGGKRLYTLARRGISVEVQPSRVEIFELAFGSVLMPELSFSVRCSKGTYIRQLAKDLALAMGTVGSLLALRRCSIGGYCVADAVRVEDLSAEVVLDRRFVDVA